MKSNRNFNHIQNLESLKVRLMNINQFQIKPRASKSNRM